MLSRIIVLVIAGVAVAYIVRFIDNVIYKADDISDSNSGYDQYDNTTQHSF